jgi:hypothetical protein
MLTQAAAYRNSGSETQVHSRTVVPMSKYPSVLLIDSNQRPLVKEELEGETVSAGPISANQGHE